MPAGYDKGGALTILDEFGFYPSPGVFMPSDSDFLETKYTRIDLTGDKKNYTFGNSRANMNILVEYEP